MGDNELQVFADRLRELRKSLNLTQKEFADKIGITAAALSSYENNQINPSISVIKRISQDFKTSSDWLLGFSDKKELGNDIETYGDAINAIISLINTDTRWDLDITYGMNLQNNVYEIGTIYTTDTIIIDFINKLGDMRALLMNGTIDQYLFDLWLSDRLKKYKDDIISRDDLSDKTDIIGDIGRHRAHYSDTIEYPF